MDIDVISVQNVQQSEADILREQLKSELAAADSEITKLDNTVKQLYTGMGEAAYKLRGKAGDDAAFAKLAFQADLIIKKTDEAKQKRAAVESEYLEKIEAAEQKAAQAAAAQTQKQTLDIPQTPKPDQTPQTAGAVCPQCGAQNPPSMKFCGSCGTKLQNEAQTPGPQQSAFKFCGECGAKNNSDDSFCSECGTPLI